MLGALSTVHGRRARIASLKCKRDSGNLARKSSANMSSTDKKSPGHMARGFSLEGSLNRSVTCRHRRSFPEQPVEPIVHADLDGFEPFLGVETKLVVKTTGKYHILVAEVVVVPFDERGPVRRESQIDTC